MDKGTQEEVKMKTWDEWYKYYREELTKLIGAAEYSTRDRNLVPANAKDLLVAFEFIRAIIDRLDDQHQLNKRLQTQLTNAVLTLKELNDKFSEYEEPLKYVKQFADDKEREDREKEKWK